MLVGAPALARAVCVAVQLFAVARARRWSFYCESSVSARSLSFFPVFLFVFRALIFFSIFHFCSFSFFFIFCFVCVFFLHFSSFTKPKTSRTTTQHPTPNPTPQASVPLASSSCQGYHKTPKRETLPPCLWHHHLAGLPEDAKA